MVAWKVATSVASKVDLMVGPKAVYLADLTVAYLAESMVANWAVRLEFPMAGLMVDLMVVCLVAY